MAADPHWQIASLRKFPDVLLSQSLGGNRLLEAHVEILFPAHQGLVRTPERKKGGSVVQQKRDGGKLGLLLRNKGTLIEGHPHSTEAFRGGGRFQKLHIMFYPDSVFQMWEHEHIPDNIPQGDRIVDLPGNKTVEMDIGQHREDQRVHVVDAHLRKGDITPPAQIVEHFCHIHSSYRLFVPNSNQTEQNRGKNK